MYFCLVKKEIILSGVSDKFVEEINNLKEEIDDLLYDLKNLSPYEKDYISPKIEVRKQILDVYLKKIEDIDINKNKTNE